MIPPLWQKLKSMFWTLRTTQPLIVRIITNRKILQGTGVPVHLTCLLRNLYAGKEATVRTKTGTFDWFKIGKGMHQGKDRGDSNLAFPVPDGQCV